MWIKSQYGLIDISKSHHIYIKEYASTLNKKTSYYIMAEFMCTRITSEWESDTEQLVIQEFDNREDAQQYLDSIHKILEENHS